jgi:integrase/recombinase XerD
MFAIECFLFFPKRVDQYQQFFLHGDIRFHLDFALLVNPVEKACERRHTIRAYLSELRYLFVYYPDVAPEDFGEDMVLQYLLYLIKTLGCSRVKCRMAAQSISFFFRHVLRRPYVIPSVIYPRKSTKLPAVMSREEVLRLVSSVQNVKHRYLLLLLYSSGRRLSEISALRIRDIDSKTMRIKVQQGKGAKDRYTLLSEGVLQELRAYWLIYRPVEYLFNGSRKGRAFSQNLHCKCSLIS